MHLCIIGSGTSGWLTANYLKELKNISKVTIIGSPKIPHIGVGESTTLSFPKSLKKFNVDMTSFIKESHAAVKYGVYYQNWGPKDFIHFFKSQGVFDRSTPKLSARKYIQLLGNKPKDTFIHDIYGNQIWKEAVGNNNILLEYEITKKILYKSNDEYPFSYHFDAGKFIEFLKSIALKSPKIQFVEETVENVNFKGDDYIDTLNLTNNINIQADYYVNTTGQGLDRKNIFNEKYDPLDHILLTDKAVVYPLKYTNKREQFHPYTVAKTMKNGWRWITPTWERIGTGYVFSSNHVSEDEAINEFLEDIGDKSLQPKVVDFAPRISKKSFKLNHCSIGMANGFLEPLDAPGLAMTNLGMVKLSKLLEIYSNDISSQNVNELSNNKLYNQGLHNVNHLISESYKFWVAFIFNQYKSCHRLDSSFWVDHKNIQFKPWDNLVKDLNKSCDEYYSDWDIMMVAVTLASRDIPFTTPLSKEINPLNFPLKDKIFDTQHHLDWIESFHKL